MNDFILLDGKDNVVTLFKDLPKGHLLNIPEKNLEVVLQEDVPKGHKVAIAEIKNAENVCKYGKAIGLATRDIHIGQLVHVHNLKSKRGKER